MEGAVDPETYYTKQNCIGMSRGLRDKNLEIYISWWLTSLQAVGALEKYTKGMA